MPFKDHLDNTLKLNPEPTPLFKMILSALAITIPLIIGYLNHQIFVAMFGALMSLVFYLNDHFGEIKKRLAHLFAIFILLIISFYAGSTVAGNNYTECI